MKPIKTHHKLLVVDIDGTLLNKAGTISMADSEALDRVRRAGIAVCLCTGRASMACAGILRQLRLDGYHIFFDGAVVMDPVRGNELYARSINKEMVREMVKVAHLDGVCFDLYSSTHYFIERETWASEIRRRFFGLVPTFADFNDLVERERIIKGTLLVRSPEERAKAGAFHRHFEGRLSFSFTTVPAYPGIDFINVLGLGVSKRNALEALLETLGISLAEVMAIGDGPNDIDLLSSVGLAIAMGNASDEVKAATAYVTLDVDHGGVAAAVNKYLLSA